jgi:hypothetical protein
MIAPRNHHLPVFTRVNVGNDGNLRGRDGLPWIAQQ